MLKPKVWIDALKLRWALEKYPVYSPPNMRNEIELPIGMARDNFNYFQTNLALRGRSFRMFMKTFAIDATTDDRGLVAVRSGSIAMGACFCITSRAVQLRFVPSSTMIRHGSGGI